mgnify:CR=1 FL=1
MFAGGALPVRPEEVDAVADEDQRQQLVYAAGGDLTCRELGRRSAQHPYERRAEHAQHHGIARDETPPTTLALAGDGRVRAEEDHRAHGRERDQRSQCDDEMEQGVHAARMSRASQAIGS